MLGADDLPGSFWFCDAAADRPEAWVRLPGLQVTGDAAGEEESQTLLQLPA